MPISQELQVLQQCKEIAVTFIPINATSTIKSDILRAEAGAAISGTVTAHFDSDDISNTDVSSSNDYQFVLSHAANSSFFLEGSLLIDSSSSASIIFQFYDETNSQFIGTKGYLATNVDPDSLDPQYATTAFCCILSSDFSSADITVSLRAVSTTGTATYPAVLSFTNGQSIRPTLRIMQT